MQLTTEVELIAGYLPKYNSNLFLELRVANKNINCLS